LANFITKKIVGFELKPVGETEGKPHILTKKSVILTMDFAMLAMYLCWDAHLQSLYLSPPSLSAAGVAALSQRLSLTYSSEDTGNTSAQEPTNPPTCFIKVPSTVKEIAEGTVCI
jgi:hypothetical protein